MTVHGPLATPEDKLKALCNSGVLRLRHHLTEGERAQWDAVKAAPAGAEVIMSQRQALELLATIGWLRRWIRQQR